MQNKYDGEYNFREVYGFTITIQLLSECRGISVNRNCTNCFTIFPRKLMQKQVESSKMQYTILEDNIILSLLQMS